VDKNLSSKREDGHEVQARENCQQSGHKKVWDAILRNYIRDSIKFCWRYQKFLGIERPAAKVGCPLPV
jgi:hypothetical protein